MGWQAPDTRLRPLESPGPCSALSGIFLSSYTTAVSGLSTGLAVLIVATCTGGWLVARGLSQTDLLRRGVGREPLDSSGRPWGTRL